MFECYGRWLYCQGEPRVYVSRHELEATEHAPALPLEEWSDTETLAAMFEAISRHADIGEPALPLPHSVPRQDQPGACGATAPRVVQRKRFSPLKLRMERFVIDGEVVVLDRDGVSDFDTRHSATHNARAQPLVQTSISCEPFELKLSQLRL